ncbi:hypothetical protein CAAN1_07S06282 [[Candida] anglica]|uniref:Nudix hydrolase domain-containing protein n=1 Tax=[Candida] anglica TaxID=148631 RepID=A0ABP0EEB4_9ASCO
MTFLSVIEQVDNFPYVLSEEYYFLVANDINSTVLGYLSPEIAQLFSFEQDFEVDHVKKTVQISSTLDTFEKRNECFAKVASSWRSKPQFLENLHKGWRNELFCVYNPTSVPYLLVERSFSVLLGVPTYGVHIMGYIPSNKSNNGKLKLWIPRRSSTKPTYPGKLDNTVAGGLGYPYGLFDTVIKECAEEAGLDEEYVRSHVKSSGVVSYMYKPNENDLIVQPEIEYTYDLIFDNETDVVPHPVDGEAESFTLMDIDEVLERIQNNEFKPNCALITIDFLIRHGYITPEDDENYLEIVSRCHRRIPFPTK